MKLTITITILSVGLFNNLLGQQNPFKTFFEEKVKALRDAGLFQEYSKLELKQLTQKIIDLETELNGGFFEEEYPQDDQLRTFINLAKWDKQRVWFDDLEADVCEENKVYTTVIKDFGHMTNLLQPTNIVEKWRTKTGPVEITFENKGQRFNLTPKYNDDWLDMEPLLDTFNKILYPSGQRFEILENTDQQLFVIRLTVREKERLTKDFKIKFV
ncbi:MAG: hypothetical protein U0289_12010 [Cyclobacteriaceae bacterium]